MNDLEGAWPTRSGEGPDTTLPLPALSDLMRLTLEQTKAQIVPLLLMGLPLLVWVVGAVVVLYALMLGVVFGAVAAEHWWPVLVGGALMLVLVLALNVCSLIIHLAYTRSMADHLLGRALPSVGGLLGNLRTRPGLAARHALLLLAVILPLLLLLYVPGLIASMIIYMTLPAVVVDDMSPTEAVVFIFNDFKANPAWHLGVGAIGLLGGMVLGFIPLVGVVLYLVLMLLWTTIAYLARFGAPGRAEA